MKFSRGGAEGSLDLVTKMKSRGVVMEVRAKLWKTTVAYV